MSSLGLRSFCLFVDEEILSLQFVNAALTIHTCCGGGTAVRYLYPEISSDPLLPVLVCARANAPDYRQMNEFAELSSSVRQMNELFE